MVSHEKVDLLQLAIVAAAAAIIQKRHRMFGRKSGRDEIPQFLPALMKL